MPNLTCEQAVAEYLAATRAMNTERWVATFAPNAISHDPLGTPPHIGHEALRNFFNGILQRLKTFGLTEDHVSIAGNSAAIKWTAQATGHNGVAITFEGIDTIEVNEQGKIVLAKAYWNPAVLAPAIS